jgi:4-amino-4-deoxy-L-arabinose transferase-like glycosyltransferase
MKQYILLFVSFLIITAFFIRIKKFQDILEAKLVRKIIIGLMVVGFLFFLVFGYILHAEDDDKVVWQNIDSVAYFIQARIFSSGHLNVPSHPLKEFFSTRYCINDGKYYSKYFPGWPLILSIGISLGVAWIVNPLLGFLTIFLIYLIGKNLYDKDTGLFAAVLFLTSSYFYKYIPTYFSDPASLFFSSLFFYCVIKIFTEPKISTSIAAGLSLGISFLIRPYSAMAISLPVMGYLFVSSFIYKERPRISFITILLSLLPAVIGLLLYNYLQTGSLFVTPFQHYNPLDKLGFGLRSNDIDIEPHLFTFMDALKNLLVNLASLNITSVWLLFLFIILILINKPDKWDILLFSTLFLIILFHYFYFFKQTRYYYIAFFALFLLAARGINLIDATLKKYVPSIQVKHLNHFVLLFIVITNIFIIISPQKVFHDYEHSRELRDPFDIVKRENLKNSVVILRSLQVGSGSNGGRYMQNPLNYEGDVLFARDLKERNIELMKYYIGKQFYYYDYDSRLKTGKLTKINGISETKR